VAVLGHPAGALIPVPVPAPPSEATTGTTPPHGARDAGRPPRVRALGVLLACLFAATCNRAPSEEVPTAAASGAATELAAPTAAPPGASATQPIAPPPTSAEEAAIDPALRRRHECARVTTSVNDGARALAELEQRRERTAPDEYLDAVARELDTLALALERLELETMELAEFTRDYARTNRRAAKVARDASSAATRGHTDRLAGAESAMQAAMRDAQPLLERTARFCGRDTR
jgi:hypothetical protein